MPRPPDDRPADGAVTSEPPRPEWFTDVDDLREGAERLKRLVEARRWSEIEPLLGLSQVWAFDRPLPIAEAVAALAAVLGEAVDIHLWVEKILKAEAAAGAGHLSLNCCLMWGEPGSYADHEFELDLHLGFAQGDDGGWAFRYLGVTPGTPETIPFPQEAEAAAREGAATTTNPAAPVALAQLAAGALAPPPGQALAYIPVFVPAAALAAMEAQPAPVARVTAAAPAADAPGEPGRGSR